MCYCNPNIRTPKCNKIDCIPKNDYRQSVVIDWPLNMASSIAAQILKSDTCKKDYARILAIALLKIDSSLKQESDNKNNQT